MAGPTRMLNRTYKALTGTNKATHMPNTTDLAHWEAATTKGFRKANGNNPTKSYRREEMPGGTIKHASPKPYGDMERVVSKNERRLEMGPDFHIKRRSGQSANTYAAQPSNPWGSSGFSGPGSGPTRPVGPNGPTPPPKRGSGSPSGGGPSGPMNYGPAHSIPEHANPNGAHSVMSEVGRGGRLWGNSMHNFEQAGGMARLGTSAVRGAVVGGVSGGLFEGATGGDFWEGAKSGAMYGGVGAGARRGVRSLSGAKQGQGTFSAANKHMKSQYPEGWSKAALAMVKQKKGDDLVKATNGLK